MNKKVLKLGTRKSLLAISQSSWVARELERLNPGIEIVLEGIETRGDIILDKPLSQIEGKEFFTAELDHALLRGDVDLTVHSMKDLSVDRPSAFTLSAVPLRELPHDCILFHSSVMERLKQGKPIRIGTSSPRRLTLIPGFLKKALPRFGNADPSLQFIEIRGNVNTRLSRVHEPESSEKKLDGVVLAFAGLERLAIDAKASIELNRLLENTRMMVPPLKLCPSAPAQGALAVEARTADAETRAIVSKLHHEPSAYAALAEREILIEWGGGCHQKLGASYLPSGTLIIRGEKPNGEWTEELRGKVQKDISSFTKIEASDIFDFKAVDLSDDQKSLLENTSLVFVAHSRAAEFLKDPSFLADPKKRVWVSGTKSWFKLADQGIWVEGSAESHGIDAFLPILKKKLLRFNAPKLLVLTHHESESTEGTQNLATYGHSFREIPQKFQQNQSIYWGSGLSFQTLWGKLGPDAFKGKQHACGLGKTAKVIQEKLKPIGIEPELFSME